MKKVLLFVAALLTVSYASAQFKPEAGSVTTEMNFSLFNGDRHLNIDGLKVRYFLAENMAVRLGLNIESESTKTVTPQTIDGATNKEDVITKISGSRFMLMPGIEYHFGNIDRLSPYVGAEIGFGIGSGKASVDNIGHESGKWSKSKTPSTIFGIGAVAGFDFYVYKGLYLGAEFGLQYQSETSKSGTFETQDLKPKPELQTKVTASEFGFIPTTAIRLGWKF